MSLDSQKKTLVHLQNGIGSISYEQQEDEWYEVNYVAVFDKPEQLYSFFKDVALHFKAMSEKDEAF